MKNVGNRCDTGGFRHFLCIDVWKMDSIDIVLLLIFLLNCY